MKKIRSAAVLLAVLLSTQMAITVSATETAETGTEFLLHNQYEQYAGMYSYQGVAEQLNSIGILLGTGAGFDLENLPDRQQVCVMLVRMLGETDAAAAAYQAGTLTCPFTDVDDWAMPYVAWLYEKGIVLGVGDGKFGNTKCTAQMYVTFMLRALGYTVAWDTSAVDQADVLYADVLDLGREINIWDERLACEPQFNRGVMAAVTYQTLAANIKNTDDRLLSVLAEMGAIQAERAQPILSLYDRVDAAAALEAAAVPGSADGIRFSSYVTQDEYYEYTVLGTPQGDLADTAYSGISYDIGLDFTQGKQQLALTGEVYAQLSGVDLALPMGMWLHDGTAYVDFLDEKVRVDMTDEDALTVLPIDFGALSLAASDAGCPYYSVTDVYTQILDGTDESGIIGMVIAYNTRDFMWPIIASMLNTEGFSENAMLRVSVTTEKFIDEKGILNGVYSGMYADLTETDPQTAVTYQSQVLIESTVSYTAWGDDVTLTFPDFSLFEEGSADVR